MNNVIQLDERRAKLDEITTRNITQVAELILSDAFAAAYGITGPVCPSAMCRISADVIAQAFKKHRPEILEGILKALDTPKYRQLWRGSVDEVRQGLCDLDEPV